ncbi:MAG: hypothetical protein AAF250_16205 [Pseudomonadota bacterium]
MSGKQVGKRERAKASAKSAGVSEPDPPSKTKSAEDLLNAITPSSVVVKDGALVIKVPCEDAEDPEAELRDAIASDAMGFALKLARSGETVKLDGTTADLRTASKMNDGVGSPMARVILACELSSLGKHEAAALFHSIAPEDGVEAMLATQMAAIHSATLKQAGKLQKAEYVEQAKFYEGSLNRLARTFAAQVEALRKHRGKGTQTVRHVHVNEGGQAIVADTVNHTRLEGSDD